MIPLKKPYIRRKEMDSVLTSMVEDSLDPNNELIKSLKQIVNFNHISLLRNCYFAFREVLGSIKSEEGEVIISALAPLWVYNCVIEAGFKPLIVDVDPVTGLFDSEEVEKKVSDRSILIVNYCHYLKSEDDSIYSLGVSVLDILLNGFSDNSTGEYAIVSMEVDTLVSAKGGAALLYNRDDLKTHIKESEIKYPDIALSDLNSSFAIPQVGDLKEHILKKEKLVSLYKDAIYKSGYSLLESDDYKKYRSLPLVVKRGIKDIKKLLKDSGVESEQAFNGSIVKELPGLKCKNARSLANRTLVIPSYINLTKESVELILKLLSTLP